jgi:HAE1 family hydrophobic/amphiphilic exporter-1
MLSEYSVRKPYTVFIAVILVIILGVVSYSGMITDLLPTIDMPYVIVMTSYPGASPEKVEQTVTRPLEAALGTVGGLKNISSVSRENSSMIILEYVQNVNMDSAIIELSGRIDLVKAQLDDAVGTPMFLKISPDMMPIVVASVDREGMGIDEISSFASDTVLPAFERLDGVASVSASGLLEKKMKIVLDKDRIEKLNLQIKADLEKKLEENKDSLEKAKVNLSNGLAKLQEESSGQKAKIAQAGIQINNAIASINAVLSEETSLTAQKAAFEQEKASMQQLAELNPLFERAFPLGIAELSPEMYQAVMEQLAGKLPKEISGLSQQEMVKLSEQAAGAPARITAIDAELQNIAVRQMTLNAMKPQLDSSLEQAETAGEKLESGKVTMAIELAKTQIQLENSMKEIEKGLKVFDNSKETALESADL